MPAPQILLSAGEASGDMYASRLATALKERTKATIFGMGGDQMRAAGVEIITDYSEVSVLGITEILSHLPQLIRAMQKLVTAAHKRRPELAILTDFPGFHLRLARKLKPLGARNIYYICPQFWAWRPWRVRIVRRRFAMALCIFPFEEKFFGDAGVPVKFIGHPLVGNVAPSQTREQFFATHGLDLTLSLVTMLPGSRGSELARHLSLLREACVKIHNARPVQFVAAAAPGRAESLKSGWPNHLKVTVVEGQTYDALAHANASIVSSGTATVEAALLDAPMVVVYRVTPLTALLARPLVRTKHFSMVNLIAGREVVPELIQNDFTPDKVAEQTLRLLRDPAAAAVMRAELADVRQRLGPPGAVERAADAIATLLTEPGAQAR
ncbi:MAG TPA: lipid-A-disaccharide synthase [Candidatus Eisenbacteria bacterium]|jgi:lipid-A-disaccharide synthase|nr:lipid-A-disaccharide synthase [Candidatus Eisenbacteria bacterium]